MPAKVYCNPTESLASGLCYEVFIYCSGRTLGRRDKRDPVTTGSKCHPPYGHHGPHSASCYVNKKWTSLNSGLLVASLPRLGKKNWVCKCVCGMHTCADKKLGLSDAQLYFVQGYGHLQGS